MLIVYLLGNEVDQWYICLEMRQCGQQGTKKWHSQLPENEQDAMGVYTSASLLWTNCEFRGIVRNDIFPNTLPDKYPYSLNFGVFM